MTRGPGPGRENHWLGAAAQVALLALFCWMVGPLLVPVALGAVFAAILAPLQRRLAPRLGRLRRAAPLLLTVGALVLVVLPFGLLVARLAVAAADLFSGDPSFDRDALARFASDRLAWLAGEVGVGREALRALFTDLARRGAVLAAGAVAATAQGVPGEVLGVFVFAVALYFLLRDGHRLIRFLVSISPFGARDTDRLFSSLEAAVRGAVVGQLATSVVQGALATGALLLFGVPGALAFGVLAALLTFVPVVGTAPVTVGAVIYLLAVQRWGAAAGMAVAAVVVGISDNVVRPWVQSASSPLHPLLVLLSIFGGLRVFGVAGVFLGPVVAALAVWALRVYAEEVGGSGHVSG